MLAFLGPNGAGKTTTIKMLTGLVVPDSGTVSIRGRDPLTERAALLGVGAVLEGNRNLYWRLTVEENLRYFGMIRGLSAPAARAGTSRWMTRFDLAKRAATPVRQLSRGLQQRVAIAAALIHEPEVLLLDEPTLGLDVEAAELVKAMIREICDEGRALLLTTHQLHLAEELAHRVMILKDGNVVAHERTGDLLRKRAGSRIRIDLAQPLDEAGREALGLVGARLVDDGGLTIEVEEERLYELLRSLEPRPLHRLERADSDLSHVFLDLVRRETGESVA